MIQPQDLAPELARHYLFAALSPDDLRRTAQRAELRRLERGQILFQQGEQATRFFLVRRGHIKLYRLSPSGQEKVIDVVGPGRTFAEAVMFMQGRAYPVYAEALDPAEVVAIENASFQETLRHSFDTCSRLLATMSSHLHALVSEVDGLYLHNATYRVVSYLLQGHAAEQEASVVVRLEVPKQILAGLLSVKPETLSRVLASLRDQGLIEVHGQEIALIDRNGLRRLLAS